MQVKRLLTGHLVFKNVYLAMSESTYIPTYWYRQLKVFLASKARQSEKEKEREKKAEKCISIYFVPDDSFDL